MLVLVAVTATFRSGDTATRFFAADADRVAEVVVPVLRLAYLALLVIAFYRWLVTREGRRYGRLRRGPPSLLATFLALVLLAVGLFVFMVTVDDRTAVTTTTSFPREGVGSMPESVPLPATPDLAQPGWGIVLLAAVGLAAIVFLTVDRRRQTPAVTAPVAPSGSAAGRGHEAMIEMGQPGSPRHRVFVAYRRVEEAAGEKGLARARDETVAAHLRRLSPPDATRRLVSLYHRARFSPHVITQDGAAEAEAAGADVERELG
jgi:hypothetical protein